MLLSNTSLYTTVSSAVFFAGDSDLPILSVSGFIVIFSSSSVTAMPVVRVAGRMTSTSFPSLTYALPRLTASFDLSATSPFSSTYLTFSPNRYSDLVPSSFSRTISLSDCSSLFSLATYPSAITFSASRLSGRFSSLTAVFTICSSAGSLSAAISFISALAESAKAPTLAVFTCSV